MTTNQPNEETTEFINDDPPAAPAADPSPDAAGSIPHSVDRPGPPTVDAAAATGRKMPITREALSRLSAEQISQLDWSEVSQALRSGR